MPRRREPQLDRRVFLGRAGVGAGALVLATPGLVSAAPDRPGSGGRYRGAVARWLEGYRLAWVRRDPDAAGYAFWLNKLNQFGGNFEQAEMVKAFLVSGEYRNRFQL